MSKSKGNIIYADDLVREYGVDAVRFYMIHEMPFASDGTYTKDLLIDAINSNLANVLGNLVNRLISMSYKYFDGIIKNDNFVEDVDKELINLVLNSPKNVEIKMKDLRVADSLDAVFEIFRRCNKYIDETMPWSLANDKANNKRLNTILYNLFESIRFGAILLKPYLPETSDKILNVLNTKYINYESLDKFGYLEDNIKINKIDPLFLRIDNK